MEDDLAQEITNKITKTVVQRMVPNKTIGSISKVSKVATGIKATIENFDIVSDIHKASVQHKVGDSIKDEKAMIEDLIRLKPFDLTANRAHTSFPDIKRSPLRYLNIVGFHEWLEKHKSEMVFENH